MNNRLNEKLNRQRKLMGLNENKIQVDLKIVPEEPVNAEFKGIHRDDINEFDIDDEMDEPGERPRYGRIPRGYSQHPDEENFYKQKHDRDSLADRLDARFPDENEKDWNINRYNPEWGGHLEEGILNRVGQTFKNIGKEWKYGGAIDKWQKQTKSLKKDFDKIAALIGNVEPKISKANELFNTINTLGSNKAGFDQLKSENDLLNTSFNHAKNFGLAYQQMSQQIQQAQQASAGVAVQQTNQLATQVLSNPTQIEPTQIQELIQILADQGQQNNQIFAQLTNLLKTKQGQPANAQNDPNRVPTQADHDQINQMAADRGMTQTTEPPAPVQPAEPAQVTEPVQTQSATPNQTQNAAPNQSGYTATNSDAENNTEDDYYTNHKIDPNDKRTTTVSENHHIGKELIDTVKNLKKQLKLR